MSPTYLLLLTLWIACALIVGYVWAGYGVIAVALSRWKGLRRFFPLPEGFGEVEVNPVLGEFSLPHKSAERGFRPTVTLIVAAYNEEDWVDAKVKNCLELVYPAERLEIVFVTDGSNDGTVERLKQYPTVTVYHQPERRGKIAAVNRIVPLAKGEILVFSDANTMLNPEALLRIVRHFAHEKVGCVAGEKRVLDVEGSSSGKGEGLYWKYESFLKRADSRLWSVVGAAGELFAVRAALFEPVDSDALIEDFLMSVRLVARGYRAVYEPDATASEAPSASVREEFRRKVRICAGGFQSIFRLRTLFSFWRHGLFGFSYWSHRAFRWVLAPPAFFLLLPLSIALTPRFPLFGVLAVAHGAMLVTGWVCWRRELAGKGVAKLFKLPYYFVIMNWAALAGFMRYIRGQQKVTWEKAQRARVTS